MLGRRRTRGQLQFGISGYKGGRCHSGTRAWHDDGRQCRRNVVAGRRRSAILVLPPAPRAHNDAQCYPRNIDIPPIDNASIPIGFVDNVAILQIAQRDADICSGDQMVPPIDVGPIVVVLRDVRDRVVLWQIVPCPNGDWRRQWEDDGRDYSKLATSMLPYADSLPSNAK